MGHSSRRSRNATQSSGTQQRRRGKVHIGSSGSPVRDGSVEHTAPKDDWGDGESRAPSIGGAPRLTVIEGPQPSPIPLTSTEVASTLSLASPPAFPSEKVIPKSRTGPRGVKLNSRNGSTSDNPQQTPKDEQLWEEHFLRCLGAIPGLEQLSTGASKIEPSDLIPASPEGQSEDDCRTANRTFSWYPFQPANTSTDTSTRSPKPEWALPPTESVPAQACSEKFRKQSRFFPDGANARSGAGPCSQQVETNGCQKDLFWETAARESRLLYKKGPRVPGDGKDGRSDDGFPSESAKANERGAVGSLEAENSDDLDTGWTLLQAEEVKSPSSESLHQVAHHFGKAEQIGPDEECEWPKSDGTPGKKQLT